MTHALEATLELDGRPIVFIYMPGIAWEPSEEASLEESEGRRAQDVLLRNRGRIDRLKDPIPAISFIVSRTQTEDLMVFYGLKVAPQARKTVDPPTLAITQALWTERGPHSETCKGSRGRDRGRGTLCSDEGGLMPHTATFDGNGTSNLE